MNDEQEYDDDDDDDFIVDEPAPWQAMYAWGIITSEVNVPPAIHAAAVHWWLNQLSD